MRPFEIDSNTTVEAVDLSEGVVSLKGTTLSGKGYEISGDVNEVNIVVTRNEPSFYSDKYLPIKEDATYWLKFKIKEDTGVAYTVQLDTVDVDKSATIMADDRTTAAIDAARVRCGAPANARFRFSDFRRNYEDSTELRVVRVDEPWPVEVEFRWTEKVVK